MPAKISGTFGTTTQSGVNGQVITVTNLNDSGPGSFREAVTTTGPRTVTFEVSGSIFLLSLLRIDDPECLIAGETSPGEGISLYGDQFRIAASDVVMRHIRVRSGDRYGDGTLVPTSDGQNRDTFSISGGISNVVVDQCSFSWSIDETVRVLTGPDNLSIINCIISEPLADSVHPDGNHAYAMLLTGVTNVSIAGNIFAHTRRRCPRIDNCTVEYFNNFIYNYGQYIVHVGSGSSGQGVTADVVGNVAAVPTDPANRWQGSSPASEFFANRTDVSTVYFDDNDTNGLTLSGPGPDGTTAIVSGTSVINSGATRYAASETEALVLANAGAKPHARDLADQRIIDHIINRNGTYLDSQEDVGGYEEIESITRELIPFNNTYGWIRQFSPDVPTPGTNFYLPDSSSFIEAPTLGDVTSSKIRVVFTLTVSARGIIICQGQNDIALEFGIERSFGTDELRVFLGGTRTSLGTFTSIFGSDPITRRKIDFTSNTDGSYILKIDNGIPITGTAGRGASRVDGASLLIGARADTASTYSFKLQSGSEVGDVQLYIDDVAVRDYVMPSDGIIVEDLRTGANGIIIEPAASNFTKVLNRRVKSGHHFTLESV